MIFPTLNNNHKTALLIISICYTIGMVYANTIIMMTTKTNKGGLTCNVNVYAVGTNGRVQNQNQNHARRASGTIGTRKRRRTANENNNHN